MADFVGQQIRDEGVGDRVLPQGHLGQVVVGLDGLPLGLELIGHHPVGVAPVLPGGRPRRVRSRLPLPRVDHRVSPELEDPLGQLLRVPELVLGLLGEVLGQLLAVEAFCHERGNPVRVERQQLVQVRLPELRHQRGNVHTDNGPARVPHISPPLSRRLPGPASSSAPTGTFPQGRGVSCAPLKWRAGAGQGRSRHSLLAR